MRMIVADSRSRIATRQRGGADEAEPDIDLDTGEAGLGEGRHIRHGRVALAAGHGQRAQPAILHMRQDVRQVVDATCVIRPPNRSASPGALPR